MEAPCEFGLHRVVVTVLEGNKAGNGTANSPAERLGQQSTCVSCASGRSIHIQLRQRPDATRPNIAGVEHEPLPLLLHRKVKVVDVSATERLRDCGSADVVR